MVVYVYSNIKKVYMNFKVANFGIVFYKNLIKVQSRYGLFQFFFMKEVFLQLVKDSFCFVGSLVYNKKFLKKDKYLFEIVLMRFNIPRRDLVELRGVGFKYFLFQQKVCLVSIGFCHSFVFLIPKNVKYFLKKINIISFKLQDSKSMSHLLISFKKLKKLNCYTLKGVLSIMLS